MLVVSSQHPEGLLPPFCKQQQTAKSADHPALPGEPARPKGKNPSHMLAEIGEMLKAVSQPRPDERAQVDPQPGQQPGIAPLPRGHPREAQETDHSTHPKQK